jgi:membrane-associated protein
LSDDRINPSKGHHTVTSKQKKLFQYVAIPALAVVFYFGLILIYRALNLPTPEEIIAWATKYYELYGYWVVLIGALAEGALFINWYLPGSVVVALGVVFAKEAHLNVFLMLAMVILGFYITALINYALGRFGWYHVFLKLGLKEPLEKVETKLKDKGVRVLFTTYIHPNFGALAATAAGVLKFDFLKFALYSFVSIVLWNSFWTAVFYYFGSELLKHINLLVVVGAVLVYIIFFKSFRKKEAEGYLNVP